MPILSRSSGRRLSVGFAAFTIFIAACGSSASDTTTEDDASGAAETEQSEPEQSEPEQTDEVEPSEIGALFDDGALTEDAIMVPCSLENGTETTCHQLEVSSIPTTIDATGPYCPETIDDTGGLWVWDGDEPGLYALDSDFWDLVGEQGFEFIDGDGNITISDPAEGPATEGVTSNSCLEATADDSYHLQVLIPTEPEFLDTPTELAEISQVGLALDGVTIFGDAPSVADRGGLPPVDPCGGHVDPSGYYHWHFNAQSIQTNLDEADISLTCDVTQNVEALVGFSYDGYPIYGPEENGEVPSDTDECSGHVGETEEFGEIYHYHMTYESPSLPPCRSGAAATGTLSSPDNDNVALPGGAGGPPGGEGPPEDGEGPPGDEGPPDGEDPPNT